jgi:hypothetical protein
MPVDISQQPGKCDRPFPQLGDAIGDQPCSWDRIAGDVLHGCGKSWLAGQIQTAGPEFCHVQFPDFVPALASGGTAGGLERLRARLGFTLLPLPYFVEARRLIAGLA